MASCPTGCSCAALELPRRLLLLLAGRAAAGATDSTAAEAAPGLHLSAALPVTEFAEAMADADAAKVSDKSEGCSLAGDGRWAAALPFAEAALGVAEEASAACAKASNEASRCSLAGLAAGGLRSAAALPFAGAAGKTAEEASADGASCLDGTDGCTLAKLAMLLCSVARPAHAPAEGPAPLGGLTLLYELLPSSTCSKDPS